MNPEFDSGQPELRSVAFNDVSISTDGLTFSGYAAIFDQSADLGDFTEEVRRGAFRKVLAANPNVPMYWDHDPRHPPLATTGGGTLRLKEDGKGLRVDAELDDDHYMTPTLRSMIRRGDVTGMSFGFIAGPGNSQIEQRGGKTHRVLVGFNHLLDVSPTWMPAYAGTSAELRSALGSLRMAETWDDMQQIRSGSYEQLADGAVAEGVSDEQTPEAEPETQDAPPAEAEVEQDQEQRSGVDSVESEAAARRRRLHMMGLTLPKGSV